MEQTSVQKLARVLKVMVSATFVCNIAAFPFVPGLAALRIHGPLAEIVDFWGLVDFWELFVYAWNPVAWLVALSEWFEGSTSWVVLSVFLLFFGVCTAVILWQALRVLDTVLKGEPFTLSNAESLKTAAVCCFLISGAALARLIWGFVYYKSIAPLLTYNGLFVPVFLMAGLVCMVMSALFRQAAELKAENDLTI